MDISWNSGKRTLTGWIPAQNYQLILTFQSNIPVVVVGCDRCVVDVRLWFGFFIWVSWESALLIGGKWRPSPTFRVKFSLEMWDGAVRSGPFLSDLIVHVLDSTKIDSSHSFSSWPPWTRSLSGRDQTIWRLSTVKRHKADIKLFKTHKKSSFPMAAIFAFKMTENVFKRAVKVILDCIWQKWSSGRWMLVENPPLWNPSYSCCVTCDTWGINHCVLYHLVCYLPSISFEAALSLPRLSLSDCSRVIRFVVLFFSVNDNRQSETLR